MAVSTTASGLSPVLPASTVPSSWHCLLCELSQPNWREQAGWIGLESRRALWSRLSKQGRLRRGDAVQHLVQISLSLGPNWPLLFCPCEERLLMTSPVVMNVRGAYGFPLTRHAHFRPYRSSCQKVALVSIVQLKPLYDLLLRMIFVCRLFDSTQLSYDSTSLENVSDVTSRQLTISQCLVLGTQLFSLPESFRLVSPFG